MQFCNGMHRLAAVLFIALVLLCFTSANASRRKWRSLHQTAFGEADGQMECGRQFHDIQSKWLQSKLVLRALNWQIIESASASHRFNLTIVVHSVLKTGGSKSGPRLRISNGSRIMVGEFSGALSRRQRSRQRQQCTPSRLRSNDKGYIFFLKPTLDPTYFKHSFLPIKFRSRRLRKFDRVSCGRRNRCPKAPWIVKAIPQGVTPHKGSREVSMRFVCGARGEPAPIVRWLKNGANLVLDDRVRAQMKKRSHGIVSRLTIRPVKLTDAGNYTCVFTNLQGSVNTTFEIGVAEILNAERQLFRKDREMPAYVCDSANKTHCQNGGTCVINNFDGKPHCVCPRYFTGYICEKIDIY
ncbi:hypothetical protein BOX15_Mlig001833g1 [Macrostomum lignano]|uniref:Ig-like domain-containing protein n=1 Tax=Macrostomum lignano TaxID=282301 RepID=A0A267FGP8_9PLAT|nr:hypothetical protein BOX15_Mlig001833g1 [Macrostomum lignano]